MFKSYSMELAGRTLTLETGKMAGLANGSVLVKYGETTLALSKSFFKNFGISKFGVGLLLLKRSICHNSQNEESNSIPW